MSVPASEQMESIRAMMAAGHQSVRMERHTLLLWGIAAALLILFVDVLFSPETFPLRWQRTLGSTSFITVILVAIGVWDFKLTRQRRCARDETISFVQAQVTKVWWLLIGLIVVINVGMNFFGGGFLFYGLLLGIMGIAFYVQGLFSQQMLSWIGILLLAMGFFMVALGVPLVMQKWMTASVFGLSLPLLAYVIDKPAVHQGFNRRLGVSAAWLLLALLPTMILAQWDKANIPQGQRLTLNEYSGQKLKKEGELVVQLPAGTPVPVHLVLKGNLIDDYKTVTIPILLSRPVELALTEGELDGRYRIDEGKWVKRRSAFFLRAEKVEARLEPESGFSVLFDAQLDVRE